MKLVVQRVSKASVTVEGEIVGKINKGYMVLLGVKEGDTKKEADFLVNKLLNLRIFEDENEKMNLSIKDVNGELLIISQFTLYGDASHGNRPHLYRLKSQRKQMNYMNIFANNVKKRYMLRRENSDITWMLI